MKVSRGLTTGIAALAFALPAAACSGHHSSVGAPATSTAAPAQANISCPGHLVLPSVNPDCYFLYMVTRDHLPVSSTPDQLIAKAHNACSLMDQDTGSDPVVDVAVLVQRATQISLQQAALFTGLAAAAYCPWNVRK